MSTGAKLNPARDLLRQAQLAYDNCDDKSCAQFLWEATFSSIQQLAAQMGHPCQDAAQAKEFTRYLEREHSEKIRHAYTLFFFGLGMLDHAEEGEWSQDPEFAWTFPEFPMVIKEVTRIVETFIAQSEATKP